MDDYMKEITRFVENAIDKAKELGGAAKLHAMIKAEEAKKMEQYYRLGRKYYQLFGDTPDKALHLYVEKLKASDERIADLKEELNKENGDPYTEAEKKPKEDGADQKNEETAERSE